MNYFEDLTKVAPEVAEIYAEHYTNYISEVASMSLRDLCVNLGICPHCCDSLENLWKMFSRRIMGMVCKDERFRAMPVEAAYHIGSVDAGMDCYVICSGYCEEDDTTYYLTLTAIDTGFWVNVDDSLLDSSHKIDIPVSIGEIMDSYEF